MAEKNKNNSKNAMAIGISLGTVIGISLGRVIGISTDNLAMGTGIGVALAVALSAVLVTAMREKNSERNIPSEEDK